MQSNTQTHTPTATMVFWLCGQTSCCGRVCLLVGVGVEKGERERDMAVGVAGIDRSNAGSRARPDDVWRPRTPPHATLTVTVTHHLHAPCQPCQSTPMPRSSRPYTRGAACGSSRTAAGCARRDAPSRRWCRTKRSASTHPRPSAPRWGPAWRLGGQTIRR
jgi:hypothetical protein